MSNHLRYDTKLALHAQITDPEAAIMYYLSAYAGCVELVFSSEGVCMLSEAEGERLGSEERHFLKRARIVLDHVGLRKPNIIVSSVYSQSSVPYFFVFAPYVFSPHLTPSAQRKPQLPTPSFYAPYSSRWFEAKELCDVLNFKICGVLLRVCLFSCS